MKKTEEEQCEQWTKVIVFFPSVLGLFSILMVGFLEGIGYLYSAMQNYWLTNEMMIFFQSMFSSTINSFNLPDSDFPQFASFVSTLFVISISLGIALRVALEIAFLFGKIKKYMKN